MRIGPAVALSAAAVLLASAHARTVVRKVTVASGSSTVNYGEVAIIGSPVNSNEALVAMLKVGGGGGIGFQTTAQAFSDLPRPPLTPPLLPPGSPCGGVSVDPGVAASATDGSLYVSGLASSAVLVYRKPLGQNIEGPAVAVSCQHPDSIAWDKAFMAMGPWPQGGQHAVPEVLHVGATAVLPQQGCLLRTFYAGHSVDSGTPAMGMAWTNTPGEPGFPKQVDSIQTPDPCTVGHPLVWRTYADAAFPVVLPSGRVVLGYRDRSVDPGFPAVTYSDTAGDDPTTGRRWQLAQSLNLYGPSPSAPIFASVGAGGSWPEAWWPTLDADPTHATWVFAAIVGTANPGDQYNDIWIARSTTSAEPVGTTPGFPPAQTYRITDDMLRPDGVNEGTTSEHHVSIAIDHLGGINLLYYRTVLMIDQPNVEVRYARWPSFDDIALGHAATVRRLSGSFYAWPYGGNHDYIMIRRAGCRLYAGFTTGETGYWDAYAAMIDPVPGGSCAVADANGDGYVDAADLATFLAAYAAASPQADVDTNWSVETPDAVAFLAAYANATAGPP